MNTIKRILILLLAVVPMQMSAQTEAKVMLRADDFGMSHAVNMALKDMVETGIPFNASVMMVTPWVTEAAQIRGVEMGSDLGNECGSKSGRRTRVLPDFGSGFFAQRL